MNADKIQPHELLAALAALLERERAPTAEPGALPTWAAGMSALSFRSGQHCPRPQPKPFAEMTKAERAYATHLAPMLKVGR